MEYPNIPEFGKVIEELKLYAQLKAEYGARGMEQPLADAHKALQIALEAVKELPIDKELAEKEPNQLEAIRGLRPLAKRVLGTVDMPTYRQRAMGALIGRMAGCTLGAPVEFSSIKRMEELAVENGTSFPPRDYWLRVDNPAGIRYLKSRRDAFTRDLMDGVPVDDDIEYTLTGLVIAERHGLDFTTADVGATWTEILPIAYTAEEAALKNLEKGIDALQTAEVDNPYCEWIGADIRSDPWAYMSPGNPERAAELAYRDAYLSHRRQGIYGEMYFAAVIAAAFVLDDPMAALEAGLAEIPKECALTRAIQWALDTAPSVRDYRHARELVDDKFRGMSGVHTVNNACLTVFGVGLGGTDYTRVISETVAMGLDNDCTAATAGSLVGAIVGIDGIPEHWYARFNDTIHSYSKNCEKYSITDVVNRFAVLAEKNGCIL